MVKKKKKKYDPNTRPHKRNPDPLYFQMKSRRWYGVSTNVDLETKENIIRLAPYLYEKGFIKRINITNITAWAIKTTIDAFVKLEKEGRLP